MVTAVALAFWVPYSLKVSQPLVDLRTSARRPILLTNIASILVGFALMANMLISTQQLQQPVAASGFRLTGRRRPGDGPLGPGHGGVRAGVRVHDQPPRRQDNADGRGRDHGRRVPGRVFYGDTVLAVIIGATVVGIGSAVAYAAMPSLIMANVPITETASANGLNAAAGAGHIVSQCSHRCAPLPGDRDCCGPAASSLGRVPGCVLARRYRLAGLLRCGLVRAKRVRVPSSPRQSCWPAARGRQAGG